MYLWWAVCVGWLAGVGFDLRGVGCFVIVYLLAVGVWLLS